MPSFIKIKYTLLCKARLGKLVLSQFSSWGNISQDTTSFSYSNQHYKYIPRNQRACEEVFSQKKILHSHDIGIAKELNRRPSQSRCVLMGCRSWREGLQFAPFLNLFYVTHGWANFLLRARGCIFCFEGHVVSVTATQHYYFSVKAALTILQEWVWLCASKTTIWLSGCSVRP